MANIPRKHQTGQVLVLVVLLMAVLIGLAALALDIGRAYGVKAKLNAAVDAASFEGARVAGQGTDNADMTATAFFNANYPAGYLGATPTLTPPTFHNRTGVWEATVVATATMPTLFAGVLGWKNMNVGATSVSERSTLDMVLVLDTSNSLISPKDYFNGAKGVKQRAKDYIDMFNSTDDRIALVAFSTAAYPFVSICGVYENPKNDPLTNPGTGLDCPRGFIKGAGDGSINYGAIGYGVKDAIADLRIRVATDSEQGMQKAIDQLNSLKDTARSRKRVIVFFSDGAPNTINGTFTTTPKMTDPGNLLGANTHVSGYKKENATIYSQTDYNNGGGTYSVTSLQDPKDGIVPVSYSSVYVKLAATRTLTGSPNDVLCDANKAARNAVENLASQARDQGITIYTLGLGTQLDTTEVPTDCATFSEKGSDILKRLANTKDSDTYDSTKPTGIYCYAADDLGPCFDKIGRAISRITK